MFSQCSIAGVAIVKAGRNLIVRRLLYPTTNSFQIHGESLPAEGWGDTPHTPRQKPREQKIRNSLSWGGSAPEADKVGRERRKVEVPVGDAQVVPIVAPIAPTKHLI